MQAHTSVHTRACSLKKTLLIAHTHIIIHTSVTQKQTHKPANAYISIDEHARNTNTRIDTRLHTRARKRSRWLHYIKYIPLFASLPCRRRAAPATASAGPKTSCVSGFPRGRRHSQPGQSAAHKTHTRTHAPEMDR